MRIRLSQLIVQRNEITIAHATMTEGGGGQGEKKKKVGLVAGLASVVLIQTISKTHHFSGLLNKLLTSPATEQQ